MLVIIDSQLSQFVLNSIQMVGAKLKVTCKEGDIIILYMPSVRPEEELTK